MNEQVNYAKIQRIQDNLDALAIGQFGTGFVTDAMLYESGIKNTVAQHTTDLADVATYTRKFNPQVVAYLSQGGSVTWETYGDEALIRSYFQSFKDAGIKYFAMCVQVQPHKAQRDAFAAQTITEDDLVYDTYPTLAKVIENATIGVEYGISLVGIKMQDTWLKENEANLTFSKWFPQYSSLTMSFANSSLGNDYLTILNEHATKINVEANHSAIITTLQNVKSAGRKTGFSGVHTIDSAYTDYIDGIYAHFYPAISTKMENTTLEDGLVGWNSSGCLDTLRKLYKNYPTKEIIITESGVQSYWDALTQPETGVNWTLPSTDGKPQSLFYYGLFETFKNEDYLKGAWLFYTNPILSHTQKLIKKYIGKGE